MEEMPRLRQSLQWPRLLVKRDDQTGLALRENKTRKFEFLMANALSKGADAVITPGAPQSHHCLQTGAAAAHVGVDCELVLGGSEPEVPNGNVLLDLFCSAKLHWTTREARNTKMEEAAEGLRSLKRKPYIIPVGGSNGIDALGYVQAMLELNEQLLKGGTRVGCIVFASSLGGRQELFWVLGWPVSRARSAESASIKAPLRIRLIKVTWRRLPTSQPLSSTTDMISRKGILPSTTITSVRAMGSWGISHGRPHDPLPKRRACW